MMIDSHGKKAVIYGLGYEYEKQKIFLSCEFDIVGYSDKKKMDILQYVNPYDIGTLEFDYIYITSQKYFEEIKKELLEILSSCVKEEQIISFSDVWGDFNHIRHNWIKDKILKLEEGKILLDAGAGEQQYAQYCKHLKYIAQDFGKYDPNDCQKGIVDREIWDTSNVNIVCDIVDIPLDDESVDAVLCTEVFEHLKNPIMALKELTRILKSGGKLILTAPFCSLTHMAPYYYANGFSEFWYKDHLSDCGYEIEEIAADGNFFKYMSQELFRTAEMAGKYSNCDLETEEVKQLSSVLKLMSRLSESDKGSFETLCYGYMVEAIKK